MPQSPTLFVRRATSDPFDDLFLLFNWANDPLVRENSFNREPITFAAHSDWFRRMLTDVNCLLLMVHADGGAPIGQARFERVSAREADISVSLAAEWRGRGVAAHAIAVATADASVKLKLDRVHAFIRKENEPSRRAFLRAGYEDAGFTQRGGTEAIHLVRVC
jgi:UDP-2,4-diacetamido-2,4,6-trideoxy-beta-L-altropyranose hydrolase